MIDSNQSSIYDLPYRARIMMSACIDSNKSAANAMKINNHINNIENLKPKPNNNNNYINCPSISGDLQPLQWLQQEAILSITPLDNEEEFVAGKEDIISITTSPVKVEVIAEITTSSGEVTYNNGNDMTMAQHNSSSTIADYYRYQAMRAAMSSSTNGGYRQQQQHGGYMPYGTSSSSIRPNSVNNNGQLLQQQHNMCHNHNHSQQQHQMPTNEYQKPPFSYTHIIFMAIETSPNKAMTVNDIYVWCETHFPYYTQAGVGWKNSLRHNLSINKSFKKISRDGRGGPGRGAYWVVEPRERNNLIDAIRRSPCSLGSFPFLNNTYPWGAGNCYSNNIFQSANTLNNNIASLTAARSVVNNKLNSSIDLQTSSRGPLLRIGGQLTDASNLIRSTPVIQRLNDSNNIIELSKTPQIISNAITLSTVPLIQFDQIKFESDITAFNESIDSNDLCSAQQDEEECRGKVFVIDDSLESNPEFYQTYLDILRGLIYNDTEKSNSIKSENIKDCTQHSKIRKKYFSKNNCKSSDIVDDILPPEAGSDSDVSESSISNKEFSELSDTDFNSRISMGLRNQKKEKKKLYFSKLKSIANNRKSYNRNRINNIVRAPHSDHIYAILQEFLPPANKSVDHSPNNHIIEDKESISSTMADDKSLSLDFSQTSLSKRSMHKLQSLKKSTKKLRFSDSDEEIFNTTNYENISRKLIRNSLSFTTGKRKIKKIHSSKMIKYNSRLLKENSEFTNKKPHRKYNYEDDEERENRCYVKNEITDDTFSTPLYKSLKFEDFDDAYQETIENYSDNKSNNFDSQFIPFKRIRLNKEPHAKRKVGRPKKSEYNSVIYKYSNDFQNNKEKQSNIKSKKKGKTQKRDLKYLKECNSNKKVATEISNKDEQVAINILANLQKKNQQERIKNMYNLSNYIERNSSDSNMS